MDYPQFTLGHLYRFIKEYKINQMLIQSMSNLEECGKRLSEIEQSLFIETGATFADIDHYLPQAPLPPETNKLFLELVEWKRGRGLL